MAIRSNIADSRPCMLLFA